MIYNKNRQLENLHLGSKEITRVFLGSKLIWENYKVINLGSGTSFNIKELFPNDYQNFTNNNFFVYGANGNPSVSGRITGSESGPRMGMNARIVKSYNATTGILNCSYYIDGDNVGTSSVGVNVAIVPDINKAIEKGNLVNLGSIRSLNIANIFPNDYKKMTNANFMILSTNGAGTGNRYYGGTFTCSGYGQLVLSYNPTTGVLDAGNNLIITNDGGGYLSSQYAYVQVYASRKAIS